MTDLFGKTPAQVVAFEATIAAASVAKSSAKAPGKKAYCKPALKRLGLLRSVTGSDIVF